MRGVHACAPQTSRDSSTSVGMTDKDAALEAVKRWREQRRSHNLPFIAAWLLRQAIGRPVPLIFRAADRVAFGGASVLILKFAYKIALTGHLPRASGAKASRPRQRPGWFRRIIFSGALKGRGQSVRWAIPYDLMNVIYGTQRLTSALTGRSSFIRHSFPGRCPGLICSAPLARKTTDTRRNPVHKTMVESRNTRSG